MPKKTFRRKVRLSNKKTDESVDGPKVLSANNLDSSKIVLKNVKPSPISKNPEFQKSLI
jgi:hypothetical protein